MVAESRSSAPERISSIVPISQAEWANTPGESYDVEEGRMPNRENRPVETFRPYVDVNEAGQLMEPWVSVPSDIGVKPADTATAEPPDDPQGCFKD